MRRISGYALVGLGYALAGLIILFAFALVQVGGLWCAWPRRR